MEWNSGGVIELRLMRTNVGISVQGVIRQIWFGVLCLSSFFHSGIFYDRHRFCGHIVYVFREYIHLCPGAVFQNPNACHRYQWMQSNYPNRSSDHLQRKDHLNQIISVSICGWKKGGSLKNNTVIISANGSFFKVLALFLEQVCRLPVNRLGPFKRNNVYLYLPVKRVTGSTGQPKSVSTYFFSTGYPAFFHACQPPLRA